MLRRIASAVAALLIAAGSSSAQSLGDVARQEETRRATTKKAAIVLSNANLRPTEIAAPAGDAAAVATTNCLMSISKGTCVSPEELIANSVAANLARQNAPLEPKWREDAHQIRSQIEWTQRSIGNLEGVVADQGRSASDRQAAEQALRSAQLELDEFGREWRRLENRAKTYDIPHAWLEPIPMLPSRAPQQ